MGVGCDADEPAAIEHEAGAVSEIRFLFVIPIAIPKKGVIASLVKEINAGKILNT